MADFLGMDPNDVRQRAAHLSSHAAAIAEMAASIPHILENSRWVGPDRDSAVAHVHGTLVPALHQTVEALEQIVHIMINDADAQEMTSST